MQKIYTYNRYLYLLCFAVLSFTLLTACNDKIEIQEEEFVIEFNRESDTGSSSFTWNAPGGFLRINTSPGQSWTLNIDFPDDEEEEIYEWCRANVNSGTGDKSVRLDLDKNLSEEYRSALISVVLTATKDTVQVRLVQLGQILGGGGSGSGGDIGGPGAHPNLRLLELPKIVDTTWTLYYSAASYSLEYARMKKHSKWVAYQLHIGCFGNSGRTDAWRFDPRIPVQYRPTRDDYRPYDRGHIVASSDRTISVAANEQTFMYSNITPQNPNLNQQTWASVERWAQNWARADTLWICAGGTIDEWVGGNINNETGVLHYTQPSNMPVPRYNFKVILRRRAGNYESIGFWFENKYYGRQANASDVQTVEEIEKRTGIEFFYNLPEDLKETVKRQFNPSAWNVPLN